MCSLLLSQHNVLELPNLNYQLDNDTGIKITLFACETVMLLINFVVIGKNTYWVKIQLCILLTILSSGFLRFFFLIIFYYGVDFLMLLSV